MQDLYIKKQQLKYKKMVFKIIFKFYNGQCNPLRQCKKINLQITRDY